MNYFEKTNDFYFANAAWAMYVTATSVGYGDIYPSTHLGRLVASISALVGIILIAILTAALAHALTFTPEQHMALSLLERERARALLVKQAACIIVYWWRLRKGTYKRTAKMDQKMYLLRTEFRQVKIAGQVDMDSFMVDTVKVNQLTNMIRETKERVEEVEDLISGKKEVVIPKTPRVMVHDRQKLNQFDRSETSELARRYGPGKLRRRKKMGGKRRFDPSAWKKSRELVRGLQFFDDNLSLISFERRCT